MGLAYQRDGRGEPVVLLHGLGNDRSAWGRLVPLLAPGHDVLAVDLPGHGGSPSLPPGSTWSPGEHAQAVEGWLDSTGLGTAHLVGNSLGGWVALELARAGRARSVTLVGSAGLWARGQPAHSAAILEANRVAARLGASPLTAFVATAVNRRVAFWPYFAHPERLTWGEGARVVAALAATRGFEATLLQLRRHRFCHGRGISVPVTVGYGSADRLVPGPTRRFDQLPAHTRHVVLPDCGHIAMYDDPPAVAELVRTTVAAARDGRELAPGFL